MANELTGRQLEPDLRRYYDAEAEAGFRTELSVLRSQLVSDFAPELAAEGWESVVDVGCGPGHDLDHLARSFEYAFGVDLAEQNVRRARDRGHRAVAGSLYELPLGTGRGGVIWTMSTLVHVPDDSLDAALRELVRVACPGAPIVIGSWGGTEFHGTHEFTRFDPPRHFSRRHHERWREMLGVHGRVEVFETFVTDQPDWEYQFAVVRPC